ncbi:hypothetical protein VT06_12360 [Arsukibacterium sp. MJ3]|uniref:DUF1190 domain-containing protein n=1 Tax=Arsukibacterium sp. MJ3 TaxID=1632859 RepID=UPI0006271672|nr:DUF1190 domain-containing protein [Arsukibacterium sp. MJ3]KKO48320.1 hypothetical protein VT06_12360 [Arsukibacterium sp. MJ3]
MKLSNSKRSQKAALIFMLPAAGLVLGGCAEKQVQAQVFSTPDECTAFYNPPAQCQAAFAEAEQLHPQVAPRYANKQECETDFGSGQCETAPQSNQQGSFFMPMMMGFMAGQMLNRGGLAPGGGQQASQQATASGRNSVPTQPLYKSRDDRNTFRTASNTAVASQPGTTNIRPSAVQPKAASLARRGGFGAQATQRSATRSYGG